MPKYKPLFYRSIILSIIYCTLSTFENAHHFVDEIYYDPIKLQQQNFVVFIYHLYFIHLPNVTNIVQKIHVYLLIQSYPLHKPKSQS